MTKEFVPYEQALKLKQLGFDEPCLSYYEGESFSHHLATTEGGDDYIIPAPLYQQAFRWFREKYNLMPLVDRSYMNLYEFQVVEKAWGYSASTYEEAELACLNKLIEIVESNTEEK